MRRTLDPKSDIVFKMLFGDPRNSGLLVKVLNDVLGADPPTTEVTILNPMPPKKLINEKGIALDVRARRTDGEQYDVEMQCYRHSAYRERSLYYLTRIYGEQLTSGMDYTKLCPCRAIWITDFRELRGERFHSTFRLLEVHDHEEFTGHFELHLLELPKLGRGVSQKDGPKAEKWGRFLEAETDEELERLAMSDPDLQEAKEALERLSADPEARMLAEQRRMAQISYQLDLNRTREDALRQGRTEGHAEGLRQAVESLCDVLDITLGESHRARLQQSDIAALESLLSYVRAHRRWPEE
jgi:predicted transposase/invertase (TIGR01784 family)